MPNFKIGKTSAANVVKNEAKLREEFENFQGKSFKHIKEENHQKFKPINEILYSWFKKCEASGIYVNGPLLKEEAMNINQSLRLPEFDGFKASESWLDKWKLSYGIKEIWFLANLLAFLKLQLSLGGANKIIL